MNDPTRDLAGLLGELLDRHRRELEDRSLSTRLELESGLVLDAAVARERLEAHLARIVALLLASLPDGCELYVSANRQERTGARPCARLLLRAQVSGRGERPPRVVQPLRPVPRSVDQVLGSAVLAEAFDGLEALDADCTGLRPAKGEVGVRIDVPLSSPVRIVSE